MSLLPVLALFPLFKNVVASKLDIYIAHPVEDNHPLYAYSVIFLNLCYN